ncbi:hypothetical protein [Streptomyces sp. NPDC059979]|uniref:hypothetical protein n=1 Tax=Streptomyces sp. NPDC059979 TaxID=3347021 RepID=UPI0036B67A4C
MRSTADRAGADGSARLRARPASCDTSSGPSAVTRPSSASRATNGTAAAVAE